MDKITYTSHGLPQRGFFIITEWCVLGDCMQPECHHCFPVKNCTKHEECIKNGIHELIPVPKRIIVNSTALCKKMMIQNNLYASCSTNCTRNRS